MSTTPDRQISDKTLADAIRVLAIDAVDQANSGHPGAPMGMAEMAVALWHRHLKHNPQDPNWPDRDRFVLSNGHASMLLYALLHLTGYALPMEEIKRFRQLHSKTPGHPEVGLTPGVETTTGPLGQGLANAVGMALGEKLLAAQYNRGGHTVVDHFTYVFLGDGCLMEGISQEALSLAGSWRLSKLIALYDDNGISIDGHVKAWFADDTAGRFHACGWNVIGPLDGHDVNAVDAALTGAKAQAAAAHGKPTIIICKTVIGHGSPGKAGTHDVHGAPLGKAENAATRVALGWTGGPFEIPAPVAQAWNAQARGAQAQDAWKESLHAYARAHPVAAAELQRRWRGDLPPQWAERLPGLLAEIAARPEAIATRKASQNALDAFAPLLPEALGGSADLTGSNLTNFKGCVPGGRDRPGNHFSWGVREFGMAAALNGLALHGGFIPYGGTFLTFSDYSRNAVRMAALMKQRVIHVFTHDSIGLGEDGPTHQSVEQVPSLRLIPGLELWRPADGLETAVAWACAIERHSGPSALALSRQATPRLAADPQLIDSIRRGGYVLSPAPRPQAVLLGTGTELALALAAQKALAEEGIAASVVSMPCTQRFDAQPAAYQEAVLPRGLPAVAVEAAHPDFWRKYVGRDGAVIGMASFGESAPAAQLYAHFGITAQAIVQAVRERVGQPVATVPAK